MMFEKRRYFILAGEEDECAIIYPDLLRKKILRQETYQTLEAAQLDASLCFSRRQNVCILQIDVTAFDNIPGPNLIIDGITPTPSDPPDPIS